MKDRSSPKYNNGRFKRIEYFLKSFRAPLYKLFNFRSENKFECPICGYYGPFMDKRLRKHAKCPRCGEVERTRLSMLVLKSLYSERKASSENVLHISPENSLRKYFKSKFKSYISADLYRKDVDYQFDIQKIPFPDSHFDLVFASHVLEYPEDDKKAISEIKRVLKLNGIAVLPVPILHQKTLDLEQRNSINRMMHEPGMDYFERLKEFFPEVEIYDPESFDDKRYNLSTKISNLDQNTDPFKSRILNLVPVCKT